MMQISEPSDIHHHKMPDTAYHTDCSNKVVRHQKGQCLITGKASSKQRVISTHLSPPPKFELHRSWLLCFLLPWTLHTVVCMQLTSRENDNTTSDLESWFSFSSPMSIIEVLWLRFSFCSLNSEPPLDTGMLSKFAIRRLTDDFSSSMYMFSISLDTNLGNLRSLDLETSTTECMFVTINNHLLQWENPPRASAEVCEQETLTNQMTNYSFPLGNVETLLLVSHRITTW